MDYAIIMAGGTGKRLWPLSRKNRPKQVLRLFEGRTLLRRCFERLRPAFAPEQIFVLTNAAYVQTVSEDLPELAEGHVIAEPAVRDTAGAIGLASAILSRHDPDATLTVVTADQVIEPLETFATVLRDGVTFVNHHPESIITFGIQPTFPSTQLGYIKLGSDQQERDCTNPVCLVEAFREKPDEATAKDYIASGQYCWNSGMFVFKAATMIEHLRMFLPDSIEPLLMIRDAWGTPDQQRILTEWFLRIPKISIDFAVMEKAPHVHAIRLACRWLDMGSFLSLAEMIRRDTDNNVIVAGFHKLLDSKDNILVTEEDGHLIALIGVQNMVVAHSKDATLICPIDQTQRLKELVETLERQHGDRFV
ncbi:MAG: mannose-1-phosphate guanylyltransferase [Sedimentisphaerales bacterium]|nr:mannose-1-phosphate guanylyltransferase [Sedimentisphaerales bacterium]